MFEVDERELKSLSSLNTANKVIAIVQKPNIKTLPDLKDGFSFLLRKCPESCQPRSNYEKYQLGLGCLTLYALKPVWTFLIQKQSKQVWEPILHLNLHVCDLTDIKQAHEDFPILLAVLDGKPMKLFNKLSKGLIVMGNEGNGVSQRCLPNSRPSCTHRRSFR